MFQEGYFWVVLGVVYGVVVVLIHTGVAAGRYAVMCVMYVGQSQVMHIHMPGHQMGCSRRVLLGSFGSSLCSRGGIDPHRRGGRYAGMGVM